MKRKFCSLVLFVVAFSASADISGRIVRVLDGDTVEILDPGNRLTRVRLAGIDAPEKRQDFGQKAKTSLSALAFQQKAVADCRKKDRYQREVCVVRVNGQDVGLAQIRRGMAWWYQQYAKDQLPSERSDYEHAELMAKLHRIGLWVAKDPTPPWEWRRNAH